MDYRVISIGTLSQHELWEERGEARSGHSTTTLIECGPRRILVDPGLPAAAIAARLAERTGLTPESITDVFLTSFRPAHRRGLPAFEHADWLIAEREREMVGTHLVEALREEQDEEAEAVLRREIEILQRCKVAADRPADHVDLFPLPGFTPGGCGLILSHPHSTTLIAGDAVATSEHMFAGRVLRGGYDHTAAAESFQEAIEIADTIVPGHDNVTINPARRGMG